MGDVTLLVVHAEGIEVRNRLPTVEAAVEPLNVGVDWSDNHGAWRSLKLGRFTRAGGGTVETRSPAPEFRDEEGNVVKRVDFRFLELRDALCRCDILGMRPGGGYEVVESLHVSLIPSEAAPRAVRGGPGPRAKSPKVVDKRAVSP